MNSPHDMPMDGDDDVLLAAEYVLGLLADADRRRAVSRMESDSSFAAEVAAWESRFAPWLAGIVPVAPPADAWARIERSVTAIAAPSIASPPRQVAAAVAGDAQPGWWNRLAVWRGLALTGFAAAAASIAALTVTLQREPAPSPPPQVVAAPPAAMPMVVSLRQDDGSMAYTAMVDASTGVITLVPASMPGSDGDPELWVIASDGIPRSLGVVARDRAMRVTIPATLRGAAEAGSTFAVTIEPIGGSPSGKPTGPVVAKGSLVSL